MFANASLARRIERAEVGLILEGARAGGRRVPAGQLVTVEFNGGAAVYLESGAPFNKVVGVGFDGLPAQHDLDAIERQFAERDAAVQFEISNLGDPALGRLLTTRGYQLVGFENVLGLSLDAAAVARLARGSGTVDVAPARHDELPLWLDVVTEGFLHPDTLDGPASHETIDREVLERVFGDTAAAAGFERYLARIGGAVVGGATFRTQDGVAQLSGAATHPQHRRQGVQSALLRHRLAEGARRGCDIAVVTTQPGSKSQENAHRAGFHLLYTRAVLVRSFSAAPAATGS